MNAPTRRSRFVPLVLLAVLSAIGFAGQAGAHGPDPMLGGALWSQDQSVPYTWKADQAPPAWMAAAIDAAAADSNASRASRAAVFSRAAGAPSLISYGEPMGCSAAAIGCANRADAPRSFRIWFRASGHMFDWGRLRWCQSPGNDTNGCYDAEALALHEFGHIEVLDHHSDLADASDWWDSVMHVVARAKPRDGYNQHADGRCDTARLQLEYDRPSWSAPFSGCLSIPTLTSLSASATSIWIGGSVTFRADLRTAAGAAHRALSNDPINRRTVALQRRALGTSTWTTIATMSPSSTIDGRYTSVVSPTATYDWRAVFSTPAGEGIIGSTSSVIRVTVSGCTIGCPQAIDS